MKKDELFTILDTVARGVAETFGPNCETLIQDLTTLSHPILAIYNSQVTGRSVGSTTSIKMARRRSTPWSSAVCRALISTCWPLRTTGT